MKGLIHILARIVPVFALGLATGYVLFSGSTASKPVPVKKTAVRAGGRKAPVRSLATGARPAWDPHSAMGEIFTKYNDSKRVMAFAEFLRSIETFA